MLEPILEAIAAGRVEPLYLLTGDRVVAEPAGQRIADAIAQQIGCEVEHYRRPAELAGVLSDLRTLSLFGSGKVALVIESRVLADSKDVADLLDDAAESLPISAGDELSTPERRAAGRLLQALRLFQVDPYAGSAEEALERLPAWAFQGGSSYRRKSKNRPRGKRQVQDLRTGLVELLDAAREAELVGWAESELAELAELAHGGLPPTHRLILVERSAAKDHPLVRELQERGAWHHAGQVAAAKGGRWEGLDKLVTELAGETGVGIDDAAAVALANRTLRQNEGRGESGVKEDSTERFAGEYRKLASLAGDSKISRALVEKAVDDRGDEDVWKILDAIGEGKAAQALHRIDRRMAGADDPVGTRLQLFGLVAEFARQITAVAGMARVGGVMRGERNYNRFKNGLLPRLMAERTESGKNPLAGTHPFRLHRAYLAASRMPSEQLARLPARILEAELALKGGSRRPRTVMAALVAELAGPTAGVGTRA